MLICVDLDGTLLDTVPANAASYRAALEELEAEHDARIKRWLEGAKPL